ncbi:MAG: InlB B-repeat-containing protein [Bacilli bacterium]|nr:InlB B-repeat-containing protein [Bacilli bacterium]
MNGKKVGISIGIILLIAIVVGVIFYFLPKEEEVIYKVTFDNDGVTEVVEVKEADTVVKPIDPIKEGYTFEGWYYNGTKFDFTTGITKDITLEARWLETSAKKWVVKFDTAGGKYIENLNVIDGEKIEEMPTPVKEDYKFLGWYYNNEKFDFETAVTKNITLVAKWEKVESTNEPVKVTKYTVKFDADNGSKVTSKTVEKNNTVTKPANPIKEGYKFLGWFNGNVEFNFKTKITKDITLKAKWEKVETPSEPEEKETYTVTFVTDGGNAIPEQKIEEGKTATKPTDPVKEGYTFTGWYYNDTLYSFSTLVTSNITLTAKWQKNAVITYKIEDAPNAQLRQVKVFILKDGEIVDGTAELTTKLGTTKTVEITKDGKVDGNYIVGDNIESITNIKVK